MPTNAPEEPLYTPPTSTSSTSPPPSPPSTANISLRKYIYFLPHPLPPHTPVPYTTGLPDINPLDLPPTPFEPTSTLVLTSPGKTFVDLRYLLPVSGPGSSQEQDTPNREATSAPSSPTIRVSAPSNTTPRAPKQEHTALDWGFTGASYSTPSHSPHPIYGAFSHSTWAHWLDSRVPAGEPIPSDAGDMYDIGGGLFLEHGHAFHPHLGRVASHEEAWEDVEAVSTVARPDLAQEGRGRKVCVVLRAQDDVRGVRGVVVRVGQFCQGIVRVGGDITTERWEADLEEDVADGQEERRWKRTGRTGSGFPPCSVTFRPEIVGLGGTVAYDGVEWVVEEVWEWE